MLQETYYTNGKIEFKNNVFNSREWSAPHMVDKKEIEEAIRNLKLKGRVIKDIRFISYAFNLSRARLEDYAYRQLECLSEEERQKKSDYNNIPLDLAYPRYVQLDDPMIIKFEDGDRLEIDAPQEPEFRISLNCIPWRIEPSWGGSNVDATILFDACIGKQIDRVEVSTYMTKEDPMYNEEFPKEKELVDRIILWLDDSTGISVSPFIDFVDIAIIDSNKEAVKLPFKKLEEALYNWEDLHEDEELGFIPECGTFWFGQKYYKFRDTAFIDFYSEREKHTLHIHDDDIMLVSLAISAVIGEPHDVFEDYELSYDQWISVLDEVDKLMGFETYKAFLDHFRELKRITNGKCDLSLYLNNCGLNFWKDKELHEKEAIDLRQWTELALKPGEKMFVRGM